MIHVTLIIWLASNLFFIYAPTQKPDKDSTNGKDPLKNLEHLEKFSVNKTIPDEIREVTLLALSHYPELMEVDIDFQFQRKIRGSVMQAQPKVGSLLFNKKENRAYKIKVSRHLELFDEMLPIEDLPTEVLLGWLGHELGHIMDYIDRSAVNLVSFGVKYYLSTNFVTEAEVAADSYSVASGLGPAIIATKDFVLNHDRLPDSYKNKIRALYLSPGEILSLVDVEEKEENQ